MNTWHEIMSSGGVDSYDNYIGCHDQADHYVVLTRNRDSDFIQESNFNTACEELCCPNEVVYTMQFNHWAVGWVELLFVEPCEWVNCDWRSGAWLYNWYIQAAEDLLDYLEDYPVLDEEDLSRREWEAWEETYGSIVQRDAESLLEERELEAETHFFLNDENEIELTAEQEEILFQIATENASNYSYESWELSDIVDEFIQQAVKALIPVHPDLFEEEPTPIITDEFRDTLERLLST